VKRVHASIEKIKKHSILQKIRSSEDRFEISPTLKLLFSAEEIQALTHLYQRMAAGETPAQLLRLSPMRRPTNDLGTQTASLFAREQFRMTRLQVYNWGTFLTCMTYRSANEAFCLSVDQGLGNRRFSTLFRRCWCHLAGLTSTLPRGRLTAVAVTETSSPTYGGAWAEQKDGESGEIATATCARGQRGLPWH
jgi:hypothetical protein